MSKHSKGFAKADVSRITRREKQKFGQIPQMGPDALHLLQKYAPRTCSRGLKIGR
jgi:hypothetical protein